MVNHMLSLADQTFHGDGTGMPGGFELFPSLLLAADPGSPRVVREEGRMSSCAWAQAPARGERSRGHLPSASASWAPWCGSRDTKHSLSGPLG